MSKAFEEEQQPVTKRGGGSGCSCFVYGCLITFLVMIVVGVVGGILGYRYLRGQVEKLCILSAEQGRKYIAHVRHQAGMDVSDHRRPHDGRWIFDIDSSKTVDLRINVIPTLHGDDMAIRLLDRDTDLLSLDRLGMTARQLDTYRPMLDQPGGMIRVATTGTCRT